MAGDFTLVAHLFHMTCNTCNHPICLLYLSVDDSFCSQTLLGRACGCCFEIIWLNGLPFIIMRCGGGWGGGVCVRVCVCVCVCGGVLLFAHGIQPHFKIEPEIRLQWRGVCDSGRHLVQKSMNKGSKSSR